jgi:hypothetical protein
MPAHMSGFKDHPMYVSDQEARQVLIVDTSWNAISSVKR